MGHHDGLLALTPFQLKTLERRINSTMSSRGDAPTITRRRHVLACARCRARRVKCDRAQPACSNCAKAGALCQPAAQQSTSGSSHSGSRDVDYGRLSKLEEEVARLSREVESASPSREPSLSPIPGDSGDERLYETRGRIITGTSPNYISPFSWALVADEVCIS
jgi:hypothetical protein